MEAELRKIVQELETENEWYGDRIVSLEYAYNSAIFKLRNLLKDFREGDVVKLTKVEYDYKDREQYVGQRFTIETVTPGYVYLQAPNGMSEEDAEEFSSTGWPSNRDWFILVNPEE